LIATKSTESHRRCRTCMDEDGFIPLEWNEVPEEQMIAKENEAY
jgi:hypothetical protein